MTRVWLPVLVTAIGTAAAFGSRPQGALSSKIVYTHPGHGWTANNLSTGAWFTQRPETFDMVEDLTNQDFMTFQIDDLWRAGATIVPLRPVGFQPSEVVVDNDDPGVTFEGGWFDSASPVYFGDPGDLPYRFANTSPTETAVATFRPTIPVAGDYPVYAWTLAGGNRVEQLYRVNHSGGTTEVRVDHRLVGGGLVYLGTYFFEAGHAGSVEISNQSDTVGVVIADMIRFGNGMGDIDRGGGVSGEPRSDEAALYWIERNAGQGVSSSVWRSSSDDGNASVSAPTRWAAYMNREQTGSLADRVFLSHHSNAGGGSARGVISLVNGNNIPASATPNQFLLALTLAAEINDDLVALDGSFEHDWADRSVLTLDRSDFEFGEINNLFINDEFDATIVERAFHDNQLDAELLRDSRVNLAIARATTQGLVRYFRAVDGTTPVVFAPPRVDQLSAETDGDEITLSWLPPALNADPDDEVTGYIVQRSTNGRGFDNGVLLPASETSFAFEPDSDQPVYARVFAINAGGWSPASPVVTARVGGGGASPRVLLVNGFDRQDRFLNVREPYFAGEIDRVRPRFQNSEDYAVQVARALAAADPSVSIDTAQNEQVASGGVALPGYDAVLWLLGEESVVDQTLDVGERFVLSTYVSLGGSVLLTGTEAAWDLGFLSGDPMFLAETFGVAYAADDAQTYAVAGVGGTHFEGIGLTFDDGELFYDAEFPDVLLPTGDGSSALFYGGGIGGTAGIQVPPTASRGATLFLGFPLETITTDDDRADVIGGFLDLAGIGSCLADLVEPIGELDFFDIQAFLLLFSSQDPAADLNDDGLFDFFDVQQYLTAFSAGCG